MSGWTRALTRGVVGPASGGGSVGSSSVSEEESSEEVSFLGQLGSVGESRQFEVWLLQAAADTTEDATEPIAAQQALVDRLRARLEDETAGAANAALASLAHALDRVSNFGLLADQYASVLDALSWDLCDVLLPALWREWRRACLATRFGNALQADAQLEASQRPVTSAGLTLLLHLLDQIARHAAPREAALSLRAFYEGHVQLEEESLEEELEESDEDEESKQSTSKSVDPNALSSFHRLSLAFPLLDLMERLLERAMTSPKSAAASVASTTAAPVSARQAELFHQLVPILRRTLSHVASEVARVEASGGLAVERDAWLTIYAKLAQQCARMLRPALRRPDADTTDTSSGIASASGSSSSSSSSIPVSSFSQPSSPGDALRTSVLSLLFDQLFRAHTVHASHASQLQIVLEGNRAFNVAAAVAAASNEEDDHDPPASTLTPALASVLRVHFALCSAIDACGVTARELLRHFRVKRALEARLEEEEMRAWETRGDDDEEDAEYDEYGERVRDEADDDDDDDDAASRAGSSGNAHDDEYDSGDSCENAAVALAAASEAASRKPPTLLSALRKEARAMPDFNVAGIGTYIATTLAYQYFWRIKPMRARARARGENEDESGAATDDAVTTDVALRTFLASEPDIGASFVADCASLPSSTLIDAASPYLAALLLQGMSSSRSDFVLHAIGALTGLWALLPPASVTIPPRALEASGAWLMSEALLQACFVCPPVWAPLRAALTHAWRSLLTTLAPTTRLALLQLALSACTVSSVQAVVIGRVKDLLVEAYDAPNASDAASTLTPDLLAALHAALAQAEDALRESVDFVLALVNLFTYLVLREKQATDATPAASSTTAATAAAVPNTGRIGLHRPAVRQVWSDKWQEVATAATSEVTALESEHEAATKDGADPDDLSQLLLLRNQMQLAADLAERLVQHMQ